MTKKHNPCQPKVSKDHDSQSTVSSPPFSLLPLFHTGQIVATPGALALLKKHGIQATILLQRHVRGDWGDLGGADRKANEDAVLDGGRIFSSYLLGRDKVWVITDAAGDDGITRASTCLLEPSGY